jgi:protein gp37
MSDLFHPKVSDDFINRVFAVMALCPQHTFQILTKRPKRMLEYVEGFAVGESDLIPPFGPVKHADGLRAAVHNWPLPNVWLGVSVEDQKTADERIPLLLQTPAAVRWLSYEPALGPLNLEELPSASGIGRYLDSLSNAGVDPGAKIPSKLDWVIAGGESGPHARPSHPDWFRSVRDQCHAAGVPFFFKQWGEWVQSPDSEDAYDAVRGFLTVPLGGAFKRVGKKRAGRMLDGREWNEYPSSTGLHK